MIFSCHHHNALPGGGGQRPPLACRCCVPGACAGLAHSRYLVHGTRAPQKPLSVPRVSCAQLDGASRCPFCQRDSSRTTEISKKAHFDGILNLSLSLILTLTLHYHASWALAELVAKMTGSQGPGALCSGFLSTQFHTAEGLAATQLEKCQNYIKS